MCLYCFDGEKVADRDIPVVKVLRCVRGMFGIVRYETPYMWERIRWDVLMGFRRMQAFGKEEIGRTWLGNTEVGGGFIHTYSTERVATMHTIGLSGENVLFCCIIPKGERYWTNGYEYASKSIRFVKKVG